MGETSQPGYRIYVVGAGFSYAAGLPLAADLYKAVRAHIEARYGRDTKFHRDLKEYIDYSSACGIRGQCESFIDIEMFMSYLDIEHYLRLRGSKTWSDEGNESQLMIRNAIGAIIHERTPEADKLPDVYYRFADCLSINDAVITFNYDLVLERALAHVGKPYRRFPYRYASVNDSGCVLDSDTEEVVILKLHGSIDWFDDRNFLQMKESLRRQSSAQLNLHSVFDVPSRYDVQPLVDGLLPPDDPLRHLHAMRALDAYYLRDRGLNAPFILSPSHVKFVYASPIIGLWHGLGRTGGYNLGLSIIGFSLPEHDEYIRIVLYKMLDNYGSWWDEPTLGVLKDYARFVDFRETKEAIESYRNRYSFAADKHSRFFFGGFCDEAVDFLFTHRRRALLFGQPGTDPAKRGAG